MSTYTLESLHAALIDAEENALARRLRLYHQIRGEHKAGTTQKAIADVLGISQQRVSQIIDGRNTR